jgi:hypothetical protein
MQDGTQDTGRTARAPLLLVATLLRLLSAPGEDAGLGDGCLGRATTASLERASTAAMALSPVARATTAVAWAATLATANVVDRSSPLPEVP